ncbi:MAG: oligosaccharide flippase family protein [Lachnospiraceae bacterium]|nr:oligosaccharide flippase family protein [Lachnospiraceae bacterium]
MKSDNFLKKFKSTYDGFTIQARAAIWFTVCNFLQSGISFLTTPLFTSILTKAEYGVFNVFLTWQNIITIIVTMNLASGVYLRGLVKHDDDEERFSASVQSLFIVIFAAFSAVLVLFVSFWSEVFKLPELYLYCMMIDMLLGMAYKFWTVRQRVHYRYKIMVLMTLVNVVLKTGAELFAVYSFEDRVTARIIALVAADMITLSVFVAGMIADSIRGFSSGYWKYALNYNIPLIPHYLSQVVLNQSDRIMIKNIKGEADAGVYSLAYNLAIALNILNHAILNSFNPWIYQQIKKKNYKEIREKSFRLLLIVAVCCMLLVLLAPEVILIMGSNKYDQAIRVVPPVAVSVYFTFLYSFFANFEFYFEKNIYMMSASICAAALNVGLNAVFIPRYGYMAAAYTTLVCYILYTLFHYIVMRRILYKEIAVKSIYNDRHILMLSACVTVAGLALTVLYAYMAVRLILFGIIMIIAFINRNKIMEVLKLKKTKNGDGE